MEASGGVLPLDTVYDGLSFLSDCLLDCQRAAGGALPAVGAGN